MAEMKFRVYDRVLKTEYGTFTATSGMAAIAAALRKKGFDAMAQGDSLHTDAPEKVREFLAADELPPKDAA